MEISESQGAYQKQRGAVVEMVSNEQRKIIIKRPINKLVLVEQANNVKNNETEPAMKFIDETNIPIVFGHLGHV